MFTIDEGTGIGLAYMHATTELRLGDAAAWKWAKKHWMEFVHESDTATGKVCQEIARQVYRRQTKPIRKT